MPIGGELDIYALSSFIIDAYREKHNLPIKKKWPVNELWSKEFREMVEKQS